MVAAPRRPSMQEIEAKRKGSIPENMMYKRLGMSLPNLIEDQAIGLEGNLLFNRVILSNSGES